MTAETDPSDPTVEDPTAAEAAAPGPAEDDDTQHDEPRRRPLFVDEVEGAEQTTDTDSDDPDRPVRRKPAHAADEDDAVDERAESAESNRPVDDASGQDAPGEDPTAGRRVWRCARSTTIWVIVLMVLVGIAIPAAAVISLLLGVTAFGGQQILVLSVIGGLAVLVLLFGWRLGLHPRLVAEGSQLTIVNPFRTHRRDFGDITLFTAGGDGLVIGTPDDEVEAWCVQKTTASIKAERRTRADKIVEDLWEIRDGYHQPAAEDEEPLPAEIRFAHHDDADVLTALEQSASMARLTHIFPTDHYGFPEDDVRERWHAVLADRTRQTMIAEVGGEPAGYASIGIETLHHLGVAEDFQRRGIGTELLEAAEDELFADPSIPEIELWVLEDNDVARTFYREMGWKDTEDQREAEFPPYPNEIRMVRRNPHMARRGR